MDKLYFSNLVKKLEKDLIRLNGELKAFSSSSSGVKSVFGSLNELESIVSSDERAKLLLSEELKEKQVLVLLLQLLEQLDSLKKLPDSIEGEGFKAIAFFENFRTNRSYFFESREKSIEFISKAFDLFSIDFLKFKPNFIGLISLSDLAKELDLELENNQAIKVPQEKLAILIEQVLAKVKHQVFKLECNGLKIFWKNSQTLYVEAGNDKIKRLDLQCKTLGGKYSEY